MRAHAKILTMTAFLVLAVGCSKEPVEEIQSVNQALEAARTEMVRTYAPESLERAEKAAAAFDQEIAAQRDKWAVTRNYNLATKLAEEARTAARAATDDATQAMEENRQEAMARIDEARVELESATTELGTAPVGKGNRAEIHAMKLELEAAQDKIAEMEASMQAEQYMEAKLMAEQVIETARRITGAVRTAKEMKAAGGRRT